MSKSETARATNRVTRVPMHKQNVFTAANREGFKRMWVNEYIGAVAAYELAGWAVVVDASMATHDGLAQVESQLDSVVRRVVNRDPHAPCRTAVLMEIPLELYNEDQTAEQSALEEQEKQWNKAKSNEYGSVNITY